MSDHSLSPALVATPAPAFTTFDAFSLTAEQERAVKAIVRWYHARSSQVFTLAGYAGTGKSTCVKSVIEALGIDLKRVAYVTYTGKAAQVLRNKGNPAYTIHKLIYEPKLASYIDRPTGLKKSRVCGFAKTEFLDVDLDLIVIDEVSMVSQLLLDDLLSYGKRILTLGDPAQLPPVMGVDNGLLARPDALLTQIHRQAAQNPVLWASMLAREGRDIPWGKHGETLEVLPRYQLPIEAAHEADQVITCRHKSRQYYNATMRAAYGHTGLPKKGEKLISLKNRWDEIATDGVTPLINGTMVRVLRDAPEKDVSRNLRNLHMSVAVEGDPSVRWYYLESNLDFFEPVPERDANTDGDMAHFDFGSAITVYKAQGSEWDHGVFINDGFGSIQQQQQQIYTGITRFSKSVVLGL